MRVRVRQRPPEYGGLAFCAALYAAALTAVLALSGPPAAPVIGALKAVAAGLCALAWVTAEALWRARPWAYPAARALAVGSVAVFAAPALVGLVLGEFLASFGFLLVAGCIAFVVWPMVGYLRRTAPQP
ncbi:MAG TPA: hypothetical protein VF541_04730 [Longimicrobium sp.]